jgi:hypothetical protein
VVAGLEQIPQRLAPARQDRATAAAQVRPTQPLDTVVAVVAQVPLAVLQVVHLILGTPALVATGRSGSTEPTTRAVALGVCGTAARSAQPDSAEAVPAEMGIPTIPVRLESLTRAAVVVGQAVALLEAAALAVLAL